MSNSTKINSKKKIQQKIAVLGGRGGFAAVILETNV